MVPLTTDVNGSLLSDITICRGPVGVLGSDGDDGGVKDEFD